MHFCNPSTRNYKVFTYLHKRTDQLTWGRYMLQRSFRNGDPRIQEIIRLGVHRWKLGQSMCDGKMSAICSLTDCNVRRMVTTEAGLMIVLCWLGRSISTTARAALSACCCPAWSLTGQGWSVALTDLFTRNLVRYPTPSRTSHSRAWSISQNDFATYSVCWSGRKKHILRHYVLLLNHLWLTKKQYCCCSFVHGLQSKDN